MVLKQIIAKARGLKIQSGDRFKHMSESTDSLALDAEGLEENGMELNWYFYFQLGS